MLCLAVLMSACSDEHASVMPDLAVVVPPFCVDAASPLAPTYDNVSRLFAMRCTTCHEGTDVDLSRDRAIATLVRRAVPSYESTDESCGGLLVVPGDAGVSYLAQKVTSATPCAGAQMPRGEFASQALPMCEQRLIVDWINAGSPGP